LLGVESLRYVPNKPEVILRNDDLSMLPATMPDLPDTSLCCRKRELLPFVQVLQHRKWGLANFLSLRRFKGLSLIVTGAACALGSMLSD
jgi:hypothetical protein